MRSLALLSRLSTFTAILAQQAVLLSVRNFASDDALINHGKAGLDSVWDDFDDNDPRLFHRRNNEPLNSRDHRPSSFRRRNSGSFRVEDNLQPSSRGQQVEPFNFEDHQQILARRQSIFRRGARGTGDKQSRSRSGASAPSAPSKPQRIQQLNTQIGSQSPLDQPSERLSALGPQWTSPVGSRDSSPSRSIKGMLDTPPGQMSRQNTLNTGSSFLRTSSSQDLLSSRFFPPQNPASRETQPMNHMHPSLVTKYSPMRLKDPRGPPGGPTMSDQDSVPGQASPQSLGSKQPSPRTTPPNRGSPSASESPRPQSRVPDIDSIVSRMEQARLSPERASSLSSSYQTPERQIRRQASNPSTPTAPGPRQGGQPFLGQSIGDGVGGQGTGDPQYSPVSLGWSSPKSTFSTPAKQVQPHNLDFGSGAGQSNLSPVSIGYKTPSPPPKGQQKPDGPWK